MKILSWNVNGIRAISAKDPLNAQNKIPSKNSQNFLSWLKKSEADILCFQETKAQENQFPNELREIEGFNLYTSCAQKKGYSGVAVYTKNKPLSVKNTIGKDNFDNEGRVLELEFKDFILFNIYFPNGGTSDERLKYKLDFYDYFISLTKKIKNKPLIICGDYNTAHFEIDLSRPKENENNTGFMPIERKRLDNLVSCGFTDSFRHFNKDGENYTWWDYKTGARQRNVGWRLDYFFISNAIIKNLKSASIENKVFGSDHCPVSIDIF
ncbi:MAG: exodeoxyribonuclease III [Elusimicrobiota bacterium]|jgi:exodeoxyribonuclease-3|nr:exodeoxyribonuclease III [Elusimicrobiota bacterium]